MNTLLEILGTIAATLIALLPYLRKLLVEKKTVTEIALSFARGYEQAKPDLPPAQKQIVSAHLAEAAQAIPGLHPKIVEFLTAHQINLPPPG